MTVIATLTEQGRPLPPAEVAGSDFAPEPAPAPARSRSRLFKPGWPLAAIFVPFPLWWAMGLSEFACLLLAIPMVFELVRRRRIQTPRGFGWWLLFLTWVAIGFTVLHVDAAGAVADASATRYLTWAYRLCWYLSITVVALYVVNTRKELSTVRVARIVSFMFLTVTAGGILGVLAPHFEFSSLLELILPKSIGETPFINHMIHPSAAQLMDVLGYSSPRPSAPYDYTNIWGLNFAVTLPFFLLAWCGKDAAWRRYAAPFLLLLSAIPVIYSINRGMWAALVLVGLFVAVRAALSGRPTMMLGIFVGALAIVALVASTSLGGVVSARFSSEGSEQGRTNLGTLSVTSVSTTSPVIGLGSTRNVQGNFNTITGGATAGCPRCSPPALGTQGQLWLVVFSQGVLGLIFYLAFFGLTFIRALRLRTPTTTMGLAVLVAGFVTMPVYNALGTALMVIMIAVALLTREYHEARQANRGNLPPLPTLASYLRPLRQRIGLIAALSLAGLIVGGVWQYAQGGRYVATQSMIVPDSSRLPSIGAGPMNLDTDAQFLASPAVATAVYDASGIRLANDQDILRVTATPNSRVMHISFTASTPAKAVAGATAASKVFLEERRDRLTAELKNELDRLHTEAAGLDTALRTLDSALNVVDEDGKAPLVDTRNTREHQWELLTRIQQVNFQINRVSGTVAQPGGNLTAVKVVPQRDQWNVSLASGLMLGFLLGAGLAMMLERNGIRLRRPEDVLHETGLPVIAEVPSPPGRIRVMVRRVRAHLPGTGSSAGSAHKAAAMSALTQASVAVTVYHAQVVVPLGRDPHLAAVAAHLDALARRNRDESLSGELRGLHTAYARQDEVMVGALAEAGAGSGQTPAGPSPTATGVELEHAPVHPRVAIVISQYNRSRDLRRLHNDLRGIGDEVIGVVFCR